MKSLVLAGIRKFEFLEKSPPEIKGEKDVLVRVAKVGICGSDIHYYTRGRIGDQVIEFPFTIGHECSGIVEKVGKSVTKVSPGDWVAIDPAISCGKCDQCRDGRYNTCRNLKFLGCPGELEGCLSEFIVIPEENCYKLPFTLNFIEGVLVEPLSIGIYATQFLNPKKEKIIGILGSGPIGLCVLLRAKEIGIERIFMTDKIDERLFVARNLGADWTGNPDEIDIIEEVGKIESGGLDAVFECCGEIEAIKEGVELLKPGGKLIIIGIPEVEIISFDINKLRRKELTIFNVRRQNNCVEKAINFLLRKRINIDLIVTHNFKFEDAPMAFEIVEKYQNGVIKAIISLLDFK
ncbi:MAG: alcohol dehydrogenase catalytic domain-containing protein [candidate division WOR-3 bacterium]